MTDYVIATAIIVLAALVIITCILVLLSSSKVKKVINAGTLLVTTDASDGSRYASMIFDDRETQQMVLNADEGTEIMLVVKQQYVES